MNIEDVCKSRKIPRSDIEAPLLVPALSSTIFGILDDEKKDTIGDIHKLLIKRLNKAVLFSAYDICNEHIDKNEIQKSDIVFLDSGIYERDCYKKAGKYVDWSFRKYIETLDDIKPTSIYVLVNFDKENNIEDQISEAENFFNRYPNCIRDFLYKPKKKDRFVNINELITHVDELKIFDIIGLTENELGPSPLKRCENLLQLRLALNSVKFSKPIHVFGCLDFLSILSFYFCGADIIDGLSWLRYGFLENISISINNFALAEGYWGENIQNIYNITYLRNISTLKAFSETMKEFSRNYDFSIFNLQENILNQLKLLINNAGIDVRV